MLYQMAEYDQGGVVEYSMVWETGGLVVGRVAGTPCRLEMESLRVDDIQY